VGTTDLRTKLSAISYQLSEAYRSVGPRRSGALSQMRADS